MTSAAGMDEKQSIVAHGSRNEEISSKCNPYQQKCKRRCTSDSSKTKDSKRMCCRDNSDVNVEDNKDDCCMINKLPSSIVIKIFKELTLEDRLLRVSRVCKYWHELSEAPELWQKIQLAGKWKLSNKVLEKLLGNCEKVISVGLDGCRGISDSGLDSLTEKCRDLKELTLERCDKLTGSSLSKIGKYCNRLEEINLASCLNLTDDALSSIARGCPRLKRLNINLCVAVTDKSVSDVALFCPQLQVLSMHQCEKVKDRALKIISRKLLYLKSLEVSKCKFTADGLNFISKMHGLSSLDVSNIPELDDEIFGLIAKGCPELTSINLSLCLNVTNNSLQMLGKYLKKVTHLFLVSCRIDDSGLFVLATNCQMLQKLDVSCCKKLTYGGATAVASGCPRLGYLGLLHCDLVTHKDAVRLCREFRRVHVSTKMLDAMRAFRTKGTGRLFVLAKHCQMLQKLDVSWCQKLTYGGAKELASGCPRLGYLGLMRCDLVMNEEADKLAREFRHIHVSTMMLDFMRVFRQAETQGYVLDHSITECSGGWTFDLGF